MSNIRQSLSEQSSNVATLFHVYQPIEHYLRLCAPQIRLAEASVVPITAIDAFLMHTIAAYYPAPLSVLDLAADATAGVSTFFWANEEHLSRIIAAHVAGDATPRWDWRSCFADVAKEYGVDTDPVILSDATLGDSAEWSRLSAMLSPLSSVLITLAALDNTDLKIDEQLEYTFDLFADAIVLLLPLGLIGSDTTVGATLEFCASHSDYRLTALREISPFFASSRLGLVSRSDNPHIPEVIERIQQLYEGNFQFLSMVQHITQNAQREERSDRLIEGRSDGYIDPEAVEQKNAHIQWLESRLYALETELLPWKNEYITELEAHVRNLHASKALKVSNAAQRLGRRVSSLRNGR